MLNRSPLYRALLPIFALGAVPEGGGVSDNFAPTKHVTLPTLSLKTQGVRVDIRFESAIKQGKNINAEDTKEPAHIATVLNLADGGLYQIVLAKQLRGTLEEEYPEAGYVGKIFRLENLGKKPGGKSAEGYNVFKITEGEWNGPDLPPVGAMLSSAAKASKKGKGK